jgi:hypothetical protein
VAVAAAVAAEAAAVEAGDAGEAEKWRRRQQRQWNDCWSNTTINQQKPNMNGERETDVKE